jgi:hypothetical protein
LSLPKARKAEPTEAGPVDLEEAVPGAAQAQRVAPAGSRAHLAVLGLAVAQGPERMVEGMELDQEAAVGVADLAVRLAAQGPEHPAEDMELDQEAGVADLVARPAAVVPVGREDQAAATGWML